MTLNGFDPSTFAHVLANAEQPFFTLEAHARRRLLNAGGAP
jgi:hypothetical protein